MGTRFECTDAIRQFFLGYEEGNESADTAFLGGAYAETFLFGGPTGHQAVRRDDFTQVVPRMRAFYRGAGLASTKLRSVEEQPLDLRHVIVRVEWEMNFVRANTNPLTETASATYVLRIDPEPRIIFQLDHQDLRQRVQELGLV
jgi:hypothetical protein